MVELNVLAINPSRRTALVGECKWSANPVGINILGDLKHHSAKMAQESNIEHIYYALFSRRDFTDALKVKATREETGLFTIENLVQG